MCDSDGSSSRARGFGAAFDEWWDEWAGLDGVSSWRDDEWDEWDDEDDGFDEGPRSEKTARKESGPRMAWRRASSSASSTTGPGVRRCCCRS